MSIEKIDVVVVGGGLSGLAAAYHLSASGRQVILLERGDSPGSKNVTGGRMYVEPIRRYLPEIINAKDAPFERVVVKEILVALDDDSSALLEYGNRKWQDRPHQSYTILRSRFDNWFSTKVMEKGGFVIPKRRVDDLLWEDGRVAGVRAGGEDIPARLVIAADGALSFISQKAGLRSMGKPPDYAVGIKELYRLDASQIEERFGVNPGEGVACLFTGTITKGLFGGGFLYTNRDTISVGIVVSIGDLMKEAGRIESHELMEGFVARPEIQRWLKGAQMKEYSAHLISEAGVAGLSSLFTDGMLVVGDAAGLSLNMGLTVRGMEFAIASGVLAAETAVKALERDDLSAGSLSSYESRLKESFILRDMETFRHSREVLENPRFHTVYPGFLCELLGKLYTIDDGPKASISSTIKEMRTKYISAWEGFKDLLSLRKI
jgi:electron transfer flavoprotein-quinone oxidoreductase